jgi:hypothetical protein
MQIFIKSPVKFEGIHYLSGSQNIEDNLALRMVLAGVATKVVGDDQVIEINGVFDSSNNFKGIENPITKALIPVGPGGGTGNVVQNVTFAAAAASPINLALGNIIKVGVLTGNLTLASPSNPVADTFYTYYFEQDATGGRVVTFPNSVNYGSGNANQKLVVTFFYDGIDFLSVPGGA